MNTTVANDVEAIIAKEVKAIQASARPRFLATCHNLGIHEGTTQYHAGCPSDKARLLIGMFSGTKAHKEAVLDAYELYLAESERVIFFPGPKMLTK